MHENTILFLSSNPSYFPALHFDFEENLPQRTDYINTHSDNIEMYLSFTSNINIIKKSSDIDIIMENFDNLEFLNIKFNELREKEIDKKITSYEKNLLYNIIEKRILKFPNPYWPKNHARTEEIKNRYLLLEKKFNRKYKTKKINKLFNIMSSWLG